MHQQSRNNVWIYALIVFIAAILMYGITETSTYSGDDLQYSEVIQNDLTGDLFYDPTGSQAYLSHVETQPIPPLSINPDYVAEWPTSLLAAKIGHSVGLSGTVIRPIQVLRVIVGALGLAIFFLAIFQLVRNIPISLLVTLGLGLTVSYWTYSIHMDESINMVTILCLAFYIFVRQTRAGFTRSGLLLLIVVLAFASFYNLTAAVSTVAFGVGVALFSQRASLFARVQKLFGFGLVYTAVVTGVIAAAIAILVSPATIVDPTFWRAATFAGRPEYIFNPIRKAIRAAIGLGRSQILFNGVHGPLKDYFETASTANRVLLLGYYGIILLLLASPFIFLAVRRKQFGEKGKMAVFLVTWLLAHTLFNWWWDPGFNKYWLIPLVCCWAIFALALDHIRTTLTRYYRGAFAAVIAFIALSFLANLTTQFLPDSRAQDNKWLAIATQMKTASQPEDLFLSPGHQMDFYLSFFGRRDILSAKLVSYATGDNQSVLDATFTSRIASHLADNGKIYVYGLETLNDAQRTAFEKLLGNGILAEKWTLPGTTIYEWKKT